MRIYENHAVYLGDRLDGEEKRLWITLDAITESWAILAKKGAGKTHTGHVLAEGFLQAEQQIAAIDPTGVWWGLRSAALGKAPGYPIIVVGGRHKDVPIEPTAGKILADFLVDSGKSVVFDVSEFSKRKQAQFVTDFAERLFERNEKPLHLFIDEADAFAPQKPYPEQMRMLGAIDEIVRRGRVKGLGVTLITQRSAVLNKDVLSQTEILVVMRTTFPGDIKAIDEWIQRNASIGDRELFHETIQKLPRGEAWVWSPGSLELFARIAVRAKLTFDSSATPKVGETRHEPRERAIVDLAKLQSAIASTVEKANAENPEILRAEITRLKRELMAKTPVTVATKIERVEVPVFDKADIDMLEKHRAWLEEHVDQAKDAANAMAATASRLSAAASAARTISLTHDKFAGDRADRIEHRGRARRVAGAVVSQAALADGSAEPLPRGERAVLARIAQHREAGVTRAQLLVLTAYKKSSRDTYLKRLSARGMVETDGTNIWATEAGFAALGPDYEPLPTGDELLSYWKQKLSPGELAVLEAAVARFPDPVSRELIDEATGYKKSSRDTYVKRLAARRLIDVVEGGVRASKHLFSSAERFHDLWKRKDGSDWNEAP